ncbi:MAG: mechanosensitive ion channel family protein [Syntrophomonadaceae bacterium]|nr:mechanosensitive ion channel family protein [Syntrophomonadaceae bacterium]
MRNTGAFEAFFPWITQIGIALGIFLVVYLFRKFLVKKILNLLHRLTSRTSIDLDNYLVVALDKPLQLFFAALGIYLALTYLPLSAETDVLISRVFRSVLVILAASCLWNLVGLYVEHSEEYGGLPGVKIDLILLPFVSRVVKFIIASLALIVILQEWDYDVNGFIAGLGLGGLAFALAAQQALSNVFGGIVIITDKPFSIGDWILTPSVEGVVEDINFRSTKIRTFEQAVVTVPNSTLANEPITNWSRMGKRRINFTLGLKYDTPRDKIEKCVKDIRAMLQNHPAIHPETILVFFDSYGDSRLNIFLYFFTRTTVWEEYLRVKEDVNLKIMDILEKEGVSVAFPSTSIYFENDLLTRADTGLNAGNVVGYRQIEPGEGPD